MHYLFGYGSLLSPTSATRTLQRTLSAADLQPAMVLGYTRTWSATAEVLVHCEEVTRQATALFLDLSPVPATRCNGALLIVSDEEIVRLDVRERGYQRITVQTELHSDLVPAYTYVVAPNQKTSQGIILEGYLAIIHDALAAYSAEFGAQFWRTTQPVQGPVVRGHYTFLDVEQNKATGRHERSGH